MCNSVLRGKDWVEDFYREHKDEVNSVLDVGCGRGIWAGCLKSVKPQAIWHGIEIWRPYVVKYKKNLDRLYDKIFVEDAINFNYDRGYDFIIMGDVLEHMTLDNAKKVVKNAINHSKYICASMPLGNDPHPAEHGNPYQEHVTNYWTLEKMKEMITESGGDVFDYRKFDCAYLNHPIELGVVLAHGKNYLVRG